jgi:hypothetical protein
MEISEKLLRGIEDAKKTLDLWHRVCAEMDDGKAWSEIDKGLRPDGRWIADSQEAWEAYLRQRMYHILNNIVLVHQHQLESLHSAK